MCERGDQSPDIAVAPMIGKTCRLQPGVFGVTRESYNRDRDHADLHPPMSVHSPWAAACRRPLGRLDEQLLDTVRTRIPHGVPAAASPCAPSRFAEVLSERSCEQARVLSAPAAGNGLPPTLGVERCVLVRPRASLLADSEAQRSLRPSPPKGRINDSQRSFLSQARRRSHKARRRR